MGILRMLLRLLSPKRPKRPFSRERFVHQPLSHQPKQAISSGAVTTPVQRTVVAQATVVGACYVIDGDSIRIGDAMIRLAGIDAPELDQPYGRNAKWALLALTKGQVVRAELDGTFSYDRTVANCYLPDGRNLSLEMVKLGLALDWTRFSGGRYCEFEPPGIRKKLWRVDAKHKGRFPPTI